MKLNCPNDQNRGKGSNVWFGGYFGVQLNFRGALPFGIGFLCGFLSGAPYLEGRRT